MPSCSRGTGDMAGRPAPEAAWSGAHAALMCMLGQIGGPRTIPAAHAPAGARTWRVQGCPAPAGKGRGCITMQRPPPVSRLLSAAACTAAPSTWRVQGRPAPAGKGRRRLVRAARLPDGQRLLRARLALLAQPGGRLLGRPAHSMHSVGSQRAAPETHSICHLAGVFCALGSLSSPS